MTWKAVAYETVVPETTFVIGKAGTPDAATANDVADFYFVVPFAVTIKRLKATMKTAPSANTTLQVRKSTDSGASFADVTGATVTVNSSAKLGTSDPSDFSLSEGDVLNFSITAGGGSGSNLALFLVGSK